MMEAQVRAAPTPPPPAAVPLPETSSGKNGLKLHIVELEPWHVEAIQVQEAQRAEAWAFGAQRGAIVELRHMGPAFAAIEAGRVVGIAGLAEGHSRKATAWAMFAEDKGLAMLAMTRAILRVLAVCEYDRIDMIVRKGFDRACDYAALLGFHREAELSRFGEDGSDFIIFVRLHPQNEAA